MDVYLESLFCMRGSEEEIAKVLLLKMQQMVDETGKQRRASAPVSLASLFLC